MSRLLLSCDDSIYLSGGKYYAANQEGYDFFQRYLRVFEQLRIVCRCKKENSLKDCRVPLDDPRIEVVYITEFHRPKQYAMRYFEVGRQIKKAVEECDHAVFRLPSTIAFRVWKAFQKTGMPYACEIVYDAQDGISASTNFVNKLLWRKIDYDMRKACNEAAGVSCVTEGYLQQRYFTKQPDGFSSHYSSLSLEKVFYTAPRSFPNKSVFTIAHVSKQVAYNGRKGVKQIIEALQLLKGKGVVVNACFAGKDYGGGIVKLTKYAQLLGVKEQVRFLGFVSRQELAELHDNADLYVMPTKAEGLPRVIIEAMAKGLPCISTPVSGNPELLPEHFLVDYYDVETLANRIKEIVTDKASYEKASEENFNNSLKYEASLLQIRRDEFYNKLKKYK